MFLTFKESVNYIRNFSSYNFLMTLLTRESNEKQSAEVSKCICLSFLSNFSNQEIDLKKFLVGNDVLDLIELNQKQGLELLFVKVSCWS